VNQSDLVLLIVDASRDIAPSSQALMDETVSFIKGQTIIVANKSDIYINTHTLDFLKSYNKPVLNLSAKNGEGMPQLVDEIVKQFSAGYERYSDDLIITSNRQKDILEKSSKHIDQAINLLKNNGGFEFATVDLRQALDILGEITGETVTDDILNNIFSNFCIGK
jgi:tRNA modification GTPase